MKALLLICAILLTGCGNYVMVSESEAGGIMTVLSGKTRILKVTSNGEIDHIEIKVVTKDGKVVWVNRKPPSDEQ